MGSTKATIAQKSVYADKIADYVGNKLLTAFFRV